MSTSYQKAQQQLQEADPEALFRAQAAREWTGSIELPAEVIDYFQKWGPIDVTIAGYGNPYFLPSLSNLWEFQAGYRYESQTGEMFPDWNPDWLVVADEGGDPFIFSTSSKNVLQAHHGAGSWDPTPLFDSLDEMALCFAILGQIAAQNRDQLTDDDCMIEAHHIENARSQMVSEFGSTAKADHILTSLGWSR